MSIISINQKTCKKCGLCSTICVDGIYEKTKSGEYPKIADDKHCIDCGHCVAICPSGAVTNSRMRMNNFTPLNSTNSVDADSLETFLRSKRSGKHYKDVGIGKEKITRLLHVAQQAPSDTNGQDRKYIIVTDKKKIEELEKLVAKYYKSFLSWIKYSAVRKFLRLFIPNLIDELEKVLHDFKEMIKQYENGEKPIFRNAPCIIFITGSKGNVMAKDNCIISETYLMLEAEAMGLSSCIIGYATGAAGALDKYLGIPKGQKIHCAISIGIPVYKYCRGVDRKDPNVVWM